MGRMNFPVLLGLLLSAVMVTARGIKVHIASERKNQADAAAAEPEKTEEAIVEAVDAIKNIQADQVADEAADEPEADKRCVRGCPKILSPVCGSNGKTYDNKCLFGIAACWAKKKGLLLTSVKGSCKACDPAWKSWNGNRCKDYGKEKWCKTDGDHYGPKWEKKWGTFKLWANTKGKTALVCPQCGCGEDSNQFDGCVRRCPKILSPVCGSNGKTYANKCLFEIAACSAKKKGLLLTSVKGSCKVCDPAWKSWNGNRCKDYKKGKWCKTDGDHYGPNWKKTWGTFKRWADAKGKTALVCPQCGCGQNSN